MSPLALRSAGPPTPPLSPPTSANLVADPAALVAAPPAEVSVAALTTATVPVIDLDALLHRADLWRGAGLAGSPRSTITSGFAALDAELPGGGWPAGASIELLAEGGAAANRLAAGNGMLSLLLPAIARLTRAGRWVALIAPPLRIHAPAWAAAGVDLAHLLQVDAGDAAARSWACERCLRSGAVAAVIAWPGQLAFAQRRRLQLAAEAGGGSLFALLPGRLSGQSSPAPLRLLVEARREGASIRILKRRGGGCERRLAIPLGRPLPARKRAPAVPLIPDEVYGHALAGALAP